MEAPTDVNLAAPIPVPCKLAKKAKRPRRPAEATNELSAADQDVQRKLADALQENAKLKEALDAHCRQQKETADEFTALHARAEVLARLAAHSLKDVREFHKQLREIKSTDSFLAIIARLAALHTSDVVCEALVFKERYKYYRALAERAVFTLMQSTPCVVCGYPSAGDDLATAEDDDVLMLMELGCGGKSHIVCQRCYQQLPLSADNCHRSCPICRGAVTSTKELHVGHSGLDVVNTHTHSHDDHTASRKALLDRVSDLGRDDKRLAVLLYLCAIPGVASDLGRYNVAQQACDNTQVGDLVATMMHTVDRSDPGALPFLAEPSSSSSSSSPTSAVSSLQAAIAASNAPESSLTAGALLPDIVADWRKCQLRATRTAPLDILSYYRSSLVPEPSTPRRVYPPGDYVMAQSAVPQV